jgi:hypothetical protein
LWGFLGIVLRVLRLEVSVYNVYIWSARRYRRSGLMGWVMGVRSPDLELETSFKPLSLKGGWRVK